MNGQKIRAAIADGCCVRAVKTGNMKDWSKPPVIQFRLYYDRNTFTMISRYQAMQHLTPESLKRLSMYDSILNGRAEEQFSKRVEWNAGAKARCLTDPDYCDVFHDSARTSFSII